MHIPKKYVYIYTGSWYIYITYTFEQRSIVHVQHTFVHNCNVNILLTNNDAKEHKMVPLLCIHIHFYDSSYA